MEVVISHDQPSNGEQWNALCETNGNLLQSTLYDEVNDFYRQKPIYFECYLNDVLCGGVKIYSWEIRRFNRILGPISRSATQFGEFITIDVYCEQVQIALNRMVQQFLKRNAYVQYTCKGYYGNLNQLIIFHPAKKSTKFGVATIDLNDSEEQIFQKFHLNHRRSINKAVKHDVLFTQEVSFEEFYHLLEETYNKQNSSGPSKLFLEHMFNMLDGQAKLFGAKYNDQLVAVAMVTIYGKFGDYAFGGNRANNVGAGQFLHFNIMKELKRKNIATYSFGQAAQEIDQTNLKFSSGITSFKLRFGTSLKNSGTYTYILKPVYYNIYNTILKLS